MRLSRLLYLLVVLLLSAVYALPSITVPGATKQSDGAYYIEQDINNLQPNYINIKNNDNVSYQVKVVVDGSIPMLLKHGNIILGSGTSFTTSTFTIYPSSTSILTIQYLNPAPGLAASTLTFEFYNSSNSSQLLGTTSMILRVKFYSANQQQTQTGTGQQSATEIQQEPSTCLLPFRTKIKKTMFINETAEISLGVINQCHNHTITLVDIDVEGVPYTIARIKDAQLGTLGPGDIEYVKLTIDTHPIKVPTQLSFDVVFVAKKGTSLETATTNVEVLVLQPNEYSIPPTSSSNNQQQIPKGALPINVEYSLEHGYLVIKGAYITWNHTKIYLNRVDIQVISDGNTITYMYPIKLQPGKTYCISAIDPKHEYLPYFKCFAVSKDKLCVALNPPGKKYGDVLYYKLNSSFTIEKVYNCKTLNDVLNYKLLYDGQFTENRTFYVTDEEVHTLTFKADGYEDLVIRFRGWVPVKLLTPLPREVGNYTIQLSGTLAKSTTITLYQVVNGTLKKLATYFGPEATLHIPYPGDYILKIEPPLQEPIEYRFHIFNTTTIYRTKKEPLSSRIYSALKTVLLFGSISFVGFTIIALVIYHKVRKQTLSGAVEEITKLMRK